MSPLLTQNPLYHHFADPAGSLLSNVAFALVGLAGLRAWPSHNARQRLAYLGCLLVAAGSAWYHYQPSDASLVWDRLPMTIVFAAVFTEAMATFVHESWSRLLFPCLAAGVSSVIWWQQTGDLVPYALVQFGPMLAIPLLLFLRRPDAVTAKPWWTMLALYCAAKLLEGLDWQLLQASGGLVGGHTLKHVAAAAALAAWGRLRLFTQFPV